VSGPHEPDCLGKTGAISISSAKTTFWSDPCPIPHQPNGYGGGDGR
jgi:hypothetical protein